MPEILHRIQRPEGCTPCQKGHHFLHDKWREPCFCEICYASPVWGRGR